jgi:hypothetical protein
VYAAFLLYFVYSPIIMKIMNYEEDLSMRAGCTGAKKKVV